MRLGEIVRESREWLDDLRKDPWLVAQRVEELNPAIAKLLLNYASELTDWPLWGMGLKVKEWSDERIWLELPARRMNCSAAGDLALSSLVLLGEFGVRALLARHLTMSLGSAQILGCTVELMRPLRETIWARLEFKELEREQALQEMQRGGKSTFNVGLALLSVREVHLGQVTIQCQIVSAKALPPPT